MVQGLAFAVFPKRQLKLEKVHRYGGFLQATGFSEDFRGLRIVFRCKQYFDLVVLRNGSPTQVVSWSSRQDELDVWELQDRLGGFKAAASLLPDAELRFNATLVCCALLDAGRPSECHASNPSDFLFLPITDLFPDGISTMPTPSPAEPPPPPPPPDDSVVPVSSSDRPLWTRVPFWAGVSGSLLLGLLAICVPSCTRRLVKRRERRRERRREQQENQVELGVPQWDDVPMLRLPNIDYGAEFWDSATDSDDSARTP